MRNERKWQRKKLKSKEPIKTNLSTWNHMGEKRHIHRTQTKMQLALSHNKQMEDFFRTVNFLQKT